MLGRTSGEVHVDVVTAGTFIQVIARRTAIRPHGTALGVVEVDAGDSTVVRESSFGVEQINVFAAGAAAIVQVAITIHKVAAAFTADALIGASIVGQAAGRILSGLDVEVGDVAMVEAIAVALRLVEQMDVGGARAATLVQVIVDVLPSLVLVCVHQVVKLGLVGMADKHHVGDEVSSLYSESSKHCHEQHHGCPNRPFHSIVF